MIKKLILCEGPNELALLEILLENDLLKFTYDDLVGRTPYHARQLTAPRMNTVLQIYTGEFEIIRIGDTMREDIKIKGYEGLVKGNCKVCTKPEIEILLIIAEDKIKEFEKVKSKVKAKTFAKENITFHRMCYKNQSEFYREYFSGARIHLLVDCIQKYKRMQRHSKDELYLADLLK